MSKVGRAGHPDRWEKNEVHLKITLHALVPEDKELINFLSHLPASVVPSYIKGLLQLGFNVRHNKEPLTPSYVALFEEQAKRKEVKPRKAKVKKEPVKMEAEEVYQPEEKPSVEPPSFELQQNIGPAPSPMLQQVPSTPQEKSTGFGFLDNGPTESGNAPTRKLGF